jgi:hypothetical protein
MKACHFVESESFYKMIDPTYISTVEILWCASHKYMLLAIENRLKA